MHLQEFDSDLKAILKAIEENITNGSQEINKIVGDLAFISTAAYKYLAMLCDLHRLSPCEAYVFLDCCGIRTEETYSNISIKKSYRVLLEKELINKPSLGVYVANPYLWNDDIRNAKSVTLTVTPNTLLIDCHGE